MLSGSGNWDYNRNHLTSTLSDIEILNDAISASNEEMKNKAEDRRLTSVTFSNLMAVKCSL